jgi:hypothetical protein
MPSTATSNLTLQYTPPAGPSNSATAVFSVATAHNAQSVSNLDITSGTPPATDFVVPFGSVASAKILIIENATQDDIGIQLNTSGTDIFHLGPGGVFMVSMSSDPSVTPLIDATVQILTSPTTTQSVKTFVFGD